MYKFLLKRRIRNKIKISERKKAYLNLKEIKSVMVLFDTENFEDANHFIHQLKKMGKRVKAFVYKDIKDPNVYSNISYTVLTEKDMKDLRGESLTQIINSLSDENFDLVVDLTFKENLILLYILVSVDSPLKVGFYKHAYWVHDIVIPVAPNLAHNVKEVGNELIHYLTVISSDTESISQ